jgi:hypothetical protein
MVIGVEGRRRAETRGVPWRPPLRSRGLTIFRRYCPLQTAVDGLAAGGMHASRVCRGRAFWYHSTLGLPPESPPCHIGLAWSLQLKFESRRRLRRRPSSGLGLTAPAGLGRLQGAHDHPGWARQRGVSGQRLRDLIVVGPPHHASRSRLKNARRSSSCAPAPGRRTSRPGLNASSALDWQHSLHRHFQHTNTAVELVPPRSGEVSNGRCRSMTPVPRRASEKNPLRPRRTHRPCLETQWPGYAVAVRHRGRWSRARGRAGLQPAVGNTWLVPFEPLPMHGVFLLKSE